MLRHLQPRPAPPGMIALHLSGHGYGHMTRACEVLAEVRRRAPGVRLAVVGSVPEGLVRRAIPGELLFRRAVCDVGLVQRDALHIDEQATAAACAAFDDGWDARADTAAAFLRKAGIRLVVADIPALAFEAAHRAGIPSVGLGNFSWDWIYRHLSARQPSLARSAERAARAYRHATLLLELPFAGDLSAFPARERIGLVARRPRVPRGEARRRLGLDDRPAVLLSFGGVGLPGLEGRGAARPAGFRWLLPSDVDGRLVELELTYPDVVRAVDVVVTKPGYGIVTDAIAAGTRLVYTERGDFPEYPILVREMAPLLACEHVSNEDLLAGRVEEAVRRVLARPVPPPPDLDGAARGAARILALLGEDMARPAPPG
jgi:L-arabinokinase